MRVQITYEHYQVRLNLLHTYFLIPYFILIDETSVDTP